MTDVLPEDSEDALMIGRIWDTESNGPRVAAFSGKHAYDLQPVWATVSDLLESETLLADVRASLTTPRWRIADLVDASLARDSARPHLLAPVDLQVIKACGVTFVDSMIERVIEERTGGDPHQAARMRELVGAALGGSLQGVRPGSAEADEARKVLTAEGLWSQYLEVGIGPDPEVFTKAPVLSSVGTGAMIGIPSFSSWNNPEPELVLLVNSAGKTVGATLGNDVNLRDVEGRSALLLGKAKDNNASSALGPFIRLFDEVFTMETLRTEEILLNVQGKDGYQLVGSSNVGRISRSFEELVGATIGDHHQYPDGIALYTGTLFAPTQDRDEPGQGFTHHLGDIVQISSPHLGTLINEVGATEKIPAWCFGIRDLMNYIHSGGGRTNLAQR
ncbi:fumarylacetoacetate hydrolase family protein [Paenarthrobacter sp. Z7-10]|uniref:fumarylacetoacetate hydrolase family protein n=1 Tax=Paenarthrobacter sp. Z7-10 TaxID=2787635 RepID=UPI0022A96AAB|nr:fumarylacetoacetate hydrolase family protein [Paenarthrobacter sp. Z7-10]MCZ2404935.1 fumarylacetoacetate hydrolase family protein [Paenarthrobacter sp. Z7-10]